MSIQKITRADGTTRYVARVYVSGVQRGRAFRTRRLAKQWEGETLSQRERGTYIAPESGNAPLCEHARAWLSSLHVRPGTRAAYTSYLEYRILPALGDMPLRSIRRPHVQRFVAGLDLAPQTVRTCYTVLAAILKDAVESGLIPATPCTSIQLPETAPRPVQPLEPGQVQALAEGMIPRYEIAVWLAAGCGLRLGEALGLTAGRITWLPRGTIHVDRQLQGRELAPCKTRASVRVIPVDTIIMEKVATHLQRWPSDGLLITSKVGAPVLRAPFSAAFRRAARGAGLEGLHYHDLRHTYASLLIRAGLNVKVVQARLGHKNATETLNIYAHLWPGDEDTGRGAVDAAFTETVGTTGDNEAHEQG
jgi:integrase